ncbi:hypothetical protein BDW66DRAFT_127075 [Aspergillus desertorum]
MDFLCLCVAQPARARLAQHSSLALLTLTTFNLSDRRFTLIMKLKISTYRHRQLIRLELVMHCRLYIYLRSVTTRPSPQSIYPQFTGFLAFVPEEAVGHYMPLPGPIHYGPL